MNRLFFFLVLFLCPIQFLFAQKELVIVQGTASYVSSQNVYVKFATTEHINKGDTLFQKQGETLKQALLVKDKSSTSCVCSSFLTEKVKSGDVFYAKTLVEKKPEKNKTKKPIETTIPHPDSSIKVSPVVVAPSTDREEAGVAPKQQIRGRISAASYSSVYGDQVTHRMRYTFNFQGNRLKNTGFSTENYISFRHTIGEWHEVQDNFNNALKVYSLSVKYDFDKKTNLCLGRKINQRISSMGAIDGLQGEKGFGNFIVGAIAGSRPDYADYSLNLSLFQAGAYLSYGTQKHSRREESTLAFIEQHNRSFVDRRFVYVQHTNDLLKNLNLFASGEVDLFQNVNNVVSNKASLTNMLISLRYRVSKKLSLNAAYDNRKNIIYYESYKSYIDQLIENETRQGLRFGLNYRISKMINGGLNTSWRFQKSDINLSKNLNAYLNFNRLPWIHSMLSLSANLLQTNYLDSKIYGARLSREIIRGKLNGELYFRMVDYNYKNYENKIKQEIGGIDLSWNISRKLAFYLYYEGTFDKQNPSFNRINTRIIQRF